ncbi:MAG: hypothetical protein JWN82_315, partial [Candidatus Saccharibacteria bacterium]|nr:hypothetical protein [Candidatus Saccharibacteria bacterium]
MPSEAVNGVQYSVMVITLTGTNAYGLTAKQRKLTADFEAKEGDMGL